MNNAVIRTGFLLELLTELSDDLVHPLQAPLRETRGEEVDLGTRNLVQ